MTTDQIHRFLKYNLGLMFEGLSAQSGLEIWFSDRNLDTARSRYGVNIRSGENPRNSASHY